MANSGFIPLSGLRHDIAWNSLMDELKSIPKSRKGLTMAKALTGAALASIRKKATSMTAAAPRAFESFAAGAVGGGSVGGEALAGLSGKLKGGIGSKIGKGGLAALIMYMLLQSRQGKELGLRTAGLESEALERRTERTTPQGMFYQAMMPSVRAQEQMARQMLMQQIGGGGVSGPSLASGEELIG